MNAEIYIIREPIFSEEEVEKRVANIASILKYTDFNVLYRTIVAESKKNLEAAFSETVSGADYIDLIIVIGGLYNSTNCLIKSFFNDKGISLQWNKLSNCASFLYTQAADIPGVYLRYLDRDVILLPYLSKDIEKIVKEYVVPFLINKNRGVKNV